MRSASSGLMQKNFDAFGVRVIVRATSQASLNSAVSEFGHLISIFDHLKSGSDIARINDKAYEEPVTVSPETVNVLQTCQALYDFSDHKFDVSFVPYQSDDSNEFNAITDWDHKEKLSPGTLRLFGQQNVLLDPTTRQIRVYNKRTKLNLRGMIRGYAAEQALFIMQKNGATGGSILTDNYVAAFGSELKNKNLFCIENPDHLGNCLYRIEPTDLSHTLFLAHSASAERHGTMYDPKDTWTYRSGGITVAGQNGAWVQFAATVTTLMDDGQLDGFLKKSIHPKLAASYFDSIQTRKLNGSLLPFAKISQ